MTDIAPYTHQELVSAAPDIGDYPIPEPADGNEFSSGLYNSMRAYLDQINAYKQFQGKEAA
jgi:hypothetical protein